MAKNKSQAVIYLDRNRLDFYSHNALGILTLVFPTEVVNNLEVVKPVEFTNLVNSFITQNKITPTNLIIVLSKNIIFEKDFPKTDTEIEFKIQKFIETIPFENIASKTFRLEKFQRVVVANRDYFEGIKNAFNNNNFTIDIIIPYWALGEGTNIQNGLDLNTGKLILERYEIIKLHNILINENSKSEMKENSKAFIQNPKNLRLIVLLIIFALLTLILVALFITNILSQSPPKKSVILPSPVLTNPPTLIPTNTTQSTTSAVPTSK